MEIPSACEESVVHGELLIPPECISTADTYSYDENEL